MDDEGLLPCSGRSRVDMLFHEYISGTDWHHKCDIARWFGHAIVRDLPCNAGQSPPITSTRAGSGNGKLCDSAESWDVELEAMSASPSTSIRGAVRYYCTLYVTGYTYCQDYRKYIYCSKS